MTGMEKVEQDLLAQLTEIHRAYAKTLAKLLMVQEKLLIAEAIRIVDEAKS